MPLLLQLCFFGRIVPKQAEVSSELILSQEEIHPKKTHPKLN